MTGRDIRFLKNDKMKTWFNQRISCSFIAIDWSNSSAPRRLEVETALYWLFNRVFCFRLPAAKDFCAAGNMRLSF